MGVPPTPFGRRGRAGLPIRLLVWLSSPPKISLLYICSTRKNAGTAVQLTQCVAVNSFRLGGSSQSTISAGWSAVRKGPATPRRTHRNDKMGNSSTLGRLRNQAREASQGRKTPEKARKSTSVESGYPGSTENSKSTQSPTESAASGDSGTAYVPTAKVLALAADRLPAPAPCPTCGCPLFWLDAYNRVRCAECSPPLNATMQRGDLHVVLVDGSPAWLHAHPELTPRDEPSHTRAGSHRPPDVYQRARELLSPTLEQIDSGECDDDGEPCEKCKKKFLCKNFFGEKFCRGCQPSRRRRSWIATTASTSESCQLVALALRLRAEESPETIVWRRERAENAEREKLTQSES